MNTTEIILHNFTIVLTENKYVMMVMTNVTRHEIQFDTRKKPETRNINCSSLLQLILLHFRKNLGFSYYLGDLEGYLAWRTWQFGNDSV